MPRTRTTDVNNGADELLVKLLVDFSYEAAIKWLRRKFSSFDSSSQVDLPLGDTKNERKTSGRLDFPAGNPAIKTGSQTFDV